MKTIIGGGLAGLIAAHAFPQATILEAAPGPHSAHKALLRFRSDSVSRLTGIDFKRVKVRKGIYYNGEFHQPNIALSNMYSQKVLGGEIADRSIWNIDPVERFIAPDDFYEQLLESVGSRLHFNERADFVGAARSNEPIISTAPMPIVLDAILPPGTARPEFKRSPISVERYILPNCDVYQTIYFPSDRIPLYRASITGSLVIAEFVEKDRFGRTYSGVDRTAAMKQLQSAFDICLFTGESLGAVEQKYGKIAPINEQQRKTIMYNLTQKYNIYSLGRFATWRNILLDDVVDDIAAIKRLVRVNHAYDLVKTVSQ